MSAEEFNHANVVRVSTIIGVAILALGLWGLFYNL